MILHHVSTSERRFRPDKNVRRSLKLENRQLDDQLDHPALRLIAARPDVFSRQGHVAGTYRRRGARTFGPYYCLRYREGGRLCSVYLGRAAKLLEKVRQALAAIQKPLAQRRLFSRMEQSIRASLRVQKLRLGLLLRPFGLRLKGFEVRGWRLSPIRRLLPRRRRSIPRLSTPKPAYRRRQNQNQSKTPPHACFAFWRHGMAIFVRAEQT